jgi:RNA-directed DNA polymerase
MINTLKELRYKLKVRSKELNHILDNIPHYYYHTESTKTKHGGPQTENGVEKKRPLDPTIGKLKEIQQKIHHEIFSKLDIPSYAFGSIKGKNNVFNAKKHAEGKYFFSADLKSFFPSITYKMVYGAFIYYKFSPDVARVLTRLTTYQGVLPQGTPTSPLLANLVFASTGQKILSFLATRSITFTSFLDDFTFSSKSDFKYLTQKILTILKKDGYWLSHRKIYYKTKEPEVTGIIISKGRLLPHPKILIKQQKSNNKQLNFYISQIQAASIQGNK